MTNRVILAVFIVANVIFFSAVGYWLSSIAKCKGWM